MSFTDYAKAVLSGGLPQVLDGWAGSTKQGDGAATITPAGNTGTVEKTAPASTVQDSEPFLTSLRVAATPANLAIGVAALAAVIGLVMLVRRA